MYDKVQIKFCISLNFNDNLRNLECEIFHYFLQVVWLCFWFVGWIYLMFFYWASQIGNWIVMIDWLIDFVFEKKEIDITVL